VLLLPEEVLLLEEVLLDALPAPPLPPAPSVPESMPNTRLQAPRKSVEAARRAGVK
jgi:hypothetical protein